MSLKKFRNVKWDKKKEFNNYVKEFNLSSESDELIDIISNKNIIVVTFNSLLREKNIDFKKHHTEANLMKLYSALAIVYISDLNNKKVILSEINKVIKKIQPKKIKQDSFTTTNWEEEMIKGYNISDKELKLYFNGDKYYKEMAMLFSLPFEEQVYYDFAYLLNMYVTLNVFFNKYNTPENMDIFLVKLEIQQKMFDLLSHILPKSFNLVIINLNKWFNKFDKKFYKILTRKIEE